MAFNGTITPQDLHEHAKTIVRKLGFATYARCWFDLMILHRPTVFLSSVFACLDADASSGASGLETGAYSFARRGG